MIGDLLSNIAHAQKLSIEQIQKSIQDGTLPSYVGMPLLQEKVQQRDEAAQLLAGQKDQNQPSIGEQIMQKADQAVRPQMPQMQPQMPQQGIAAAPSNLPQQMAGGGIVAFASGDIINEDEYTSPEDREDAEMSQLYGTGTDNDLIQAIAARGRRSDIHPSAGIQVQGRSYGMDPSMATHKYAGLGLKFAQDLGVSPKLAMHVMNKETGNLENPETAKSKAGALGVMQLMPKTAKELGVTNPMDPMQNIHAGVRYLSQLSNKYNGDERLAAMAYNWGPGNVDKWLRSGGDMAKVPKETRNYVANYAEGGEVPGFAGPSGSLVGIGGRSSGMSTDTDDTTTSTDTGIPFGQSPARGKSASIASLLNNAIPSTSQRYTAANPKVAPSGYQGAIADMDVPPVGANINSASTNLNQAPTSNNTVTNNQTMPQANAGITQLSPADQYQQAILQDIQDRTAQAQKDKESNKYMALLSAGLGMLGSKSPYALTGIGEGAQQGVAAYAALQKQQSDEAKDIAAERLGLFKYQSAAETAKRHYDILENSYGNKEDIARDKMAQAAQARAAQNPQYKSIVKQLETMDPSDPMYGYYTNNLKLIEDAYANNKPISLPMPPAKVAKPGLLDRIFGSSASAKPTPGAVDTSNPLLAK